MRASPAFTASVPMALDTAIRDGRVKRGDLLLLQGKGDEAKAQYQKALAGLEKGQDYRTVVESKLATLGVPAVVDATGAAQ